MKKIIFSIAIFGFVTAMYGQNLLYLDDVEVTTDNTTTIYVEGGVILQNQSRFDNDGSIHVGSSGSGFAPANANWVNNNASEPGNNFVANGHVRLLLDGARITGTLGSPAQAYFNHLWLDAINGTNWMDIDLNFSRGLHLGSSTLEVNNQSLTVGNVDPSVIDASGGGAIRLESGPPLPGPDQWSLLQWGTDSAPQLYTLPLRSASGSNFQFTFSTLASAFPQFVAVSTYGTPQNNQPLPEGFFGNPAVNDADLDGNGSDDSANIVDRYWMIWSPSKGIGNIEFQMPSGEASTGNLTTSTSLSAFYFDGDWNSPGSGSGDALIGVTVPVNNTLIRTYALGNLTVNLPIECISFTGMQEGLHVELEWQTATETSNARFEIQRSTDGANFEQIGWVEGNGTTTERSTYLFIDELTIPGREYYYRLIQHDFDGNTEIACDIVRINTGESLTGQVSVVPNPATDFADVLLSETLIGATIQISTVDGRLLKEIPVTTIKTRIERNDLSSGIYFIKLITDTGLFTHPVKLIFVD